ncbi:MAG: DUF5615 family PIN-like protein [Gemmataceae bacterium]|nr:DUF5615 family PIN-like protein [Gemmataceae bacterium]
MNIHLDEDMASTVLAGLLEKAGHTVTEPIAAGLAGRSDAVQLAYAIREQRVCLTANHEDFEELHLLIQDAHGRHHGILVVRRENDPTRDLSYKGIVTAIRKLEAANVPIANEYIILNHWR